MCLVGEHEVNNAPDKHIKMKKREASDRRFRFMHRIEII